MELPPFVPSCVFAQRLSCQNRDLHEEATLMRRKAFRDTIPLVRALDPEEPHLTLIGCEVKG